MAHRAAHDPAQHIAAAFVRRQHAVGDQERRRAQMVGDHALRRATAARAGRRRSVRRWCRSGQRTGRSRSCRACPAARPRCAPAPCRCRSTVSAAAMRSPGATCSNCMNTRFQISMKRSPSWSGEPGGPPGILSPWSKKISEHGPQGPVSPICQKLSEVGMRMMRDSGRPAIFFQRLNASSSSEIDGDQQPVLRQAVVLGDQVPGELDRALLEIVAEREVAEHLEEGVMPRGVADIVEVVVLAAGAHAFLRGGRARIGPLLKAGEDVLELHHARIGEHQCRVVARHKRRRRHHFVAVLGKIVEKRRPDLVDTAHCRPIAPCSIRFGRRRTGVLPKTGAHPAHYFPANAFSGEVRRCPENA